MMLRESNGFQISNTKIKVMLSDVAELNWSHSHDRIFNRMRDVFGTDGTFGDEVRDLKTYARMYSEGELKSDLEKDSNVKELISAVEKVLRLYKIEGEARDIAHQQVSYPPRDVTDGGKHTFIAAAVIVDD